MTANPEFKVGAVVLVAIIGLFFVYTWLNGLKMFDNGYNMEAAFDQIDSLRPGSPVKLSGVDVGRITKIYFDNQKVIVVMEINPEFKISHAMRAVIASSGVIGDKYLELMPLKTGEPVPQGNRIQGFNPVSMDQFFATAYDVLTSLKKITGDIQGVTNQLDKINLVETSNRLDHTLAIIERISQNSEPQINDVLNNIAQTSTQISQITLTANHMLEEIDANGQTAADLRETLSYSKSIAANLDKFSGLIASKGPEINGLLSDAHQTMQAITDAAQTVDKAVTKISEGDGTISQVSQTLNQASEAAKKVSDYVSLFEKITFTNQLGGGYEYKAGAAVDYRLNMNLDDHYSVLFGLDDIGQANLVNLQWAYKGQYNTGRIGVYRSQFGAGIDFPVVPGLDFSMDLWDTRHPNLGLTTAWDLTKDWSMSVNSSTNTQSWAHNWQLEWWRHF